MRAHFVQTLAIIDPDVAYKHFRVNTQVSAWEIGYGRRPNQLHTLVRSRVAAGYAPTGILGFLIRRVITRLAAPKDLVTTEFAGSSFADTGLPTARGYAEQLGFESASSVTQVLPASTLETMLAEPNRPLQFKSNAPRINTADLVAPSFSGRVVQRLLDNERGGAGELRVEGDRLIAAESMDGEEAVASALIDAAISGLLSIRGASAGATPCSATVPRLALWSPAVQVPLRATQDSLSRRSHPWRVHMPLSRYQMNWAVYLLRNATLFAAMDALERLVLTPHQTKYDRGQSRYVGEVSECALDTRGPYGIAYTRSPWCIGLIVGRCPRNRPLILPVMGDGQRPFYEANRTFATPPERAKSERRVASHEPRAMPRREVGDGRFNRCLSPRDSRVVE